MIGYTKVTRDFTERMPTREELHQANRKLQREVQDRMAAESKLQQSERGLRQPRDLELAIFRLLQESLKRASSFRQQDSQCPAADQPR